MDSLRHFMEDLGLVINSKILNKGASAGGLFLWIKLII